jgi:hypothetical protein
MVSQRERTRLMRAFRHEPATGAAVIIKCAAGLLVVAGLAAIGAGIENPETSAVAANKLRWQQHETTAIAHSQTLHQERQARIEPKPPSTAGIELTSAHAAEVGNEVRPSSLTRSEPAPAKPRNN